jgi:hypothetical protein
MSYSLTDIIPVLGVKERVGMSDISSGAIEKVLGSVLTLIEKVAGPAADEIGLTLQDSIKVYRAKRQYRLLEKMNEFIREAGYEPDHIPLKILLPSLDYASVEDNEELHTAWAALLANACDPRQGKVVEPSFPIILRELSPRDAKFLAALCGRGIREQGRWGRSVIEVEFSEDRLREAYAQAGLSRQPRLSELTGKDWKENEAELRADLREFALSLDTLRRHALVIQITKSSRSGILGDEDTPRRLVQMFTLSSTACSLVEACKPPARSPLAPKP